MIFGPQPLAQAEGTILAHSIALQNGRLRKGHRLSAQDIEALARTGVTEIVVARLGPEDVDENDAADMLAEALMQDAQGLTRTQAFTGRVNLLAEGAGVAQMDVAAIEAINAIDPMITIATVPQFQQMRSGGMVATIKIIAYGVPRAALDRAVARARGAIRVARPRLERAGLIITEIPGGAGEKGRQAIEDRLTALDVTLERVTTVPHTRAALSGALRKADTPLTLILTGSATSDTADIGPQALIEAGGTLTRFGMPVDPGNLLFLGTLGAGDVIGLPGCARSPALNGADWVLSRVVCGIAVTAGDIAGMGVGGLLKEIPTRPQPRRGPAATKGSET